MQDLVININFINKVCKQITENRIESDYRERNCDFCLEVFIEYDNVFICYFCGSALR